MDLVSAREAPLCKAAEKCVSQPTTGWGAKPQTPNPIHRKSLRQPRSHLPAKVRNRHVEPRSHSVPLSRSAPWPGRTVQIPYPQPDLWPLQSSLLTLNLVRALLPGPQTPSSFPSPRGARASHSTQPPVSGSPSLPPPTAGPWDVTDCPVRVTMASAFLPEIPAAPEPGPRGSLPPGLCPCVLVENGLQQTPECHLAFLQSDLCPQIPTARRVLHLGFCPRPRV